MRVHSSHVFDSEELLRQSLDPGIRLTVGDEMPAGTRVLVDGRPGPDKLEQAGLEGVIIPWSGVWPAVRERLRLRPDLRVHNLHHNAVIVAEHAIALLLAASRRLLPTHCALARSDWRPRYEPDPSPLLAGRRALVLGHGAIGQRVARVLHAMDMQVHAFNRSGEGPPPASVHTLGDLDDLLPGARAIVLALPHTPATHHLFDRDRLARCHPHAVLVNVGRADLCEEDALYDALAEERLFGAGLDVWWRHPEGLDARTSTPAARRPFHELERVVLSPHRAGHSRATERLRMRDLAYSLNAWHRGDPVPHAVDLEQGY